MHMTHCTVTIIELCQPASPKYDMYVCMRKRVYMHAQIY